MSNTNSNGSGLSDLGVLQIVFIVLKLCGLISWTWPVVLIPLWIWMAAVVIGVIIAIWYWRY